MWDEPLDRHRGTFENLLNTAIVRGQRPLATPVLGPATWSAIDAIARAHPEATADDIADAFDAFAVEHG